MLGAVNPNLRSNASDGAFFSAPEVTEEQKNLYRYLRSRAQSLDEPLDPRVFEIYPGWRDYLQTLVTLNQVRNALMRKEQPLIAKIKRKLIYERQTDNLPW